MSRITILAPLLCLLAACAAEPPADLTPPLPLPPPAPPAHAQRIVPRPQPATTGVAGPAVNGQAEPAPAATAGPSWRVSRDGVVGCADRAALDVLRKAADSTPRLLAEARASGGCRTTFRVNEWTLAGADAEMVRLHLTNGAPLTLWFLRGEVVAP